MTLSTEALGGLVARASTVTERLSGGFVPRAAPGDDVRLEERLARWREVVARGDAARFARRLAFGGLGAEQLPLALGDVRLAEGQSFPAWASTLREVVETTSAASVSQVLATVAARAPAGPRPFEELFVPMLGLAWTKLRARTGGAVPPVAEAVRRALLDGLLERLLQASTPCLYFEFALQRRAWRAAPEAPGEPAPREGYLGFVRGLLGEGLWPLFQDYPVLARQVAVVLEHWVEATADLLTRLERDREALSQRFLGGRALGALCEVSPALSDSHHGGRAVHILTFEQGLRVVYKPRDLDIEVAHGRLVSWFNAQERLPPLRAVEVLTRDGYGWAEWISHAPCASDTEARDFYRRAGALVALMYVLGAVDCQVDNLIAAGDTPVLIDLEALMQTWVRKALVQDMPAGSIHERVRDFHHVSVLRSGLLPSWTFGANAENAHDSSGLNGSGGQVASILVPRWEDTNTDRMALRHVKAVLPESRNRPVLAGVALSPAAHADALDAGFTDAYRLLLEHRDALLADDGPLSALRRPAVRFLFRNTQAYASVLKLAQQPGHLMDGADHWIELDVLTRDELAGSEQRPAHWPVLEAEREALEQRDIPRFTLGASETSWTLRPGVTLPDFFEQSCHAQVLDRVRRLGDADLALQRALLRGALHASVAKRVMAVPTRVEVPTDVAPLSEEAALAAALDVAGRLRDALLRAPNGDAGLLGLEYVASADLFQFRVLSPSLYGGAAGVAVFLADVAAVSGDASLRELAVGLLAPTRSRVEVSPPSGNNGGALQRDLGLGRGVGALLWSFVRVARATGERGLLEDARRAAAWVTPDAVAADEWFDVMGGSAGALLALLALHAEAPDADVLARARACGDRLLAARTADGAGPRAWATVDRRRLTGFSHGAAGIALALLRLHAATGDAAYLQAAREAIAHEGALFSPAHDNWPDLRAGAGVDGRPGFGTTWCHGAPGIGLARVGGLFALDGPEIRQDIEAALRTVERSGLNLPDSLCCGNFGRIDVLLTCGQRLGRPEWVATARRLAAQALARAGSVDALRLLQGLPPDERALSPGLFTGLAGVGHVLLRLARPASVPSVLLFE